MGLGPVVDPPSNQPQVRFFALSKSPMFLPVMIKVVPPEATSPAGSSSEMTEPCSTVPVICFGTAPWVWPETTLIAPRGGRAGHGAERVIVYGKVLGVVPVFRIESRFASNCSTKLEKVW